MSQTRDASSMSGDSGVRTVVPSVANWSSALAALVVRQLWIVPVSLLVMLAALMRLSSLSLMEFRHDSAYWALAAWDWRHGGAFPLVGQQVGSVSVELYNGPIMTWLTAAVFAVAGEDPARVAFVIAAMNAVGVYLTWRLGRTLYSPLAAVIATALVAVAPWLVLYGRMFWPQSLFPFLMPLSLLVLTRGIRTQRVRWLVVYGVLLGIGFQLHLSMIAVAAAGGLVVLLYSARRWQIVPMCLGVALGYAPILIYDLNHNFVNLRALLQLPSLHASDESRLTHFAKTFWNFSNLLSGQGFWVSKVGDEPYMPPVLEWAAGGLVTLVFLTTTAIIIRTCINHSTLADWRSIRVPYEDAIPLIFTFVPLAYLLFSRSSIQRHYFIILFPAAFLVIARGIELWLRNPVSRRAVIQQHRRRLAIGVIGVICLLNLVTLGYAYRYLDERGGEAEYGVTLASKQTAIAVVIEDVTRHGATSATSDYLVSIASVQERLPYIFLYASETGVRLPDEAMELHPSRATTNASTEYRIIELPYAQATLRDGERVLYSSASVMVVKRETTR